MEVDPLSLRDSCDCQDSHVQAGLLDVVKRQQIVLEDDGKPVFK